MSGLLPLSGEALGNPLYKALPKKECKKSEVEGYKASSTSKTIRATKAIENYSAEEYLKMLNESRRRQRALLERKALELLGPPKNSIAKPVALNPTAAKSDQQKQSICSLSSANSVINAKS